MTVGGSRQDQGGPGEGGPGDGRPEEGRPGEQPASGAPPTVAVVITTFNDTRFLGDALASAFGQTTPPDEVIVVDDGSPDDPAPVVARFPRARLIRQENRGLSAARNTGLAAASTDFILFLDADDVLLPEAVAAGLACMAANPGAALVYGAHVVTDEGLDPIGDRPHVPPGEDPLATLLSGNVIGMHATVLYRRALLARSGGFDPALRKIEDFDVYLRIARDHPIAAHPRKIALYRQHGGNMSRNAEDMLRVALAVHASHRPAPGDGPRQRAWAEGRGNLRRDYTAMGLRGAAVDLVSGGRPMQCLRALARRHQVWSDTRPPGTGLLKDETMFARHLVGQVARGLVIGVLPTRLAQRLRRWRYRPAPDGAGPVPAPVSRNFGWERGDPIDRYYIEAFLQRHAASIRGRVLEIGDAAYSRRFGGDRITRQDVLHVHPGNPLATIIGDISQGGVLPATSFDCIIFTQTLHLIFDMQAAMRELAAALKPGGVLLLTVPGLTPVDRGEWGESWYWSLTAASVRRLCADSLGDAEAEIRTHGNIYAATAFLQGLAQQEVDRARLDPTDEAYPVVVTLFARRPG